MVARRSTPPSRSIRTTSAPTPSPSRPAPRWPPTRPATPTTTPRPTSTSWPPTASRAAGYEWYEISNWAKPGHECRHNHLYWSGGEYLAVGCAAHGHIGGRRYWNLRTPERYVKAIEEGRSPEAGSEELDADGRRVEGLQLAIRTRSGVAAADVPDGFVDELEGLVERDGDRVVLTTEGRLLANEVAIRLE